MASRPVNVSLDDVTLDRLDEWRAANGIRTRSGAIRALIEHRLAGRSSRLEETVDRLTEQSRAGSVTATVQLLRYLQEEARLDPTTRRREELRRDRIERQRRDPGVG
jgi:metal-responsive CopG/Arc/MetJ family transcriptional regulator